MAHEFAFLGASTIINFIIVIFFGIGLHFAHLCIDFESNGASNVALPNFVLKDKSVTCLKLFISAYRQVHVEGVGLLAFSSLVGLFLHLNTIVIHIHMNHRSKAIRGWIFGMAFFVSVGASMLTVKIPQDYALWHSIAVEAILVFLICFEALLLVCKKIKERGGNENLLRDLAMVSGETLVNVYMFADCLGRTRSPWNVEKIIHLFGSCLSVLSGLGQIGWLVYKCMASRVFAGEVELPAGAAINSDVEQQTVEEIVELVEQGDSNTIWSPAAAPLFSRLVEWFSCLVEWGRKTSRVFARETEMSARAATEDDEGGRQGEEVSPEEEASPA